MLIHVCKDVQKKHTVHRASVEPASSIEFKLKHCGFSRLGSSLFRQESIQWEHRCTFIWCWNRHTYGTRNGCLMCPRGNRLRFGGLTKDLCLCCTVWGIFKENETPAWSDSDLMLTLAWVLCFYVCLLYPRETGHGLLVTKTQSAIITWWNTLFSNFLYLFEMLNFRETLGRCCHPSWT